MSLEGTSGAWDVGLEVREIREVPYAESSATQPRVLGQVNPEDFSSVENTKGFEGAVEIIRTEAAQAGALIDSTREAIEATKGVTGAPNLFAEDERRLAALNGELETVMVDTSSRYTEEDKANAIKFGHTTFEWGGGHGTTSSHAAERVPTIVPAEVQHGKEVLLGRAKIPVLNEAEDELLRRTAEGIDKHKLGNLSAQEIQRMVENIEVIRARELPGDEWFQMATDLLRRQEEYDSIQRPYRVENGVKNLATGETAPIEIIASSREKFSVENPNISLRDRADLERGFQDNPRAKLEELLMNLRKYEPQNKPHSAEVVTDTTGGLSEYNLSEINPATGVVGGLSADGDSLQKPEGERVRGETIEPESLLGIQGMPTDRFFGMDREAVYNILRRTAILPDDNPARIKAMRILDLLEKGKSTYLEENPNSETVSF